MPLDAAYAQTRREDRPSKAKDQFAGARQSPGSQCNEKDGRNEASIIVASPIVEMDSWPSPQDRTRRNRQTCVTNSANAAWADCDDGDRSCLYRPHRHRGGCRSRPRRHGLVGRPDLRSRRDISGRSARRTSLWCCRCPPGSAFAAHGPVDRSCPMGADHGLAGAWRANCALR